MSRDVHITGLGIVSPLGIGKDALLEAVRTGTSGLGPLHDLAASDFRIGLGGEVANSAVGRRRRRLE